jgi:hypothetical protein
MCGRTRTRHGARRRGRRATRQTSAAPAPAQRRAARSARCTAQTSTPACCRVASFERACVTKDGAKLRNAERQRLAAQHRGDQAFDAFAHLDARVEQCRARNLEHRRVDAPQRKAVAKREQLQHRQRDAARLPRRWSRRACAACRAARRRAQPTYCTSSAAVCRAISARSGSLSRFEHHRHDARQLVDKRRREHRVGERDDEQQLERLRLRGGALDNAPHEFAALPRRGVTATRRPVETRTCEKRSSAWLSMPRCKIAAMRAHHDAPRQPSMCTSVNARSSARACALALPTAGACTESPSHSSCSASASHATRRASTRFATKRSAAAISTPRSSPSPLLKPSTQC